MIDENWSEDFTSDGLLVKCKNKSLMIVDNFLVRVWSQRFKNAAVAKESWGDAAPADGATLLAHGR